MVGIIVGSDGTLQAAIFSSSGPLSTPPAGVTIAWSSSHPNIVSVVQLSNPLQANIHGESPGTASIRCDITNSQPAGGTTVTGTLDEPCSAPPPPTVTQVIVTQIG